MRRGPDATPLIWGTEGIPFGSSVTGFLLPGDTALVQMLSLEISISKCLKSCGKKGKEPMGWLPCFPTEKQICMLTGVREPVCARSLSTLMGGAFGAKRRLYGKTGGLGDVGKSQT